MKYSAVILYRKFTINVADRKQDLPNPKGVGDMCPVPLGFARMIKDFVDKCMYTKGKTAVVVVKNSSKAKKDRVAEINTRSITRDQLSPCHPRGRYYGD